MEYIEEECPLCDRISKFYFVDHDNRKFYRCEYCTDFQVYINVEDILRNSTDTLKRQLSKASHESPHDKVLAIGDGKVVSNIFRTFDFEVAV
ncbi:hypothetical protein [Desulfopila inferna]|uniref:hypothetical protein n=1 Tax=Desulfopila inferna TaxID=468528 RepID=UPI001965C411|nr:hypothetical protein [Desulfopila inferna]MBM9606253.1 hypothetical protein [Desulfopila inferna]